MIIALSGYAQSGKDTLGAFLVEDQGFVRYAFADALKESVYRLNPIVPDFDSEFMRYQDVIERDGPELAKTNPEIRRLLQVMGTEVGRQVLGDNVWVDAVFNQVKANGDQNVVITDARFPNEAEAVKANEGFIVRIKRPGVEAINAHPSETALDEWGFDYAVINDGSQENLRLKAADLVRGLRSFDTMATPTRRLPGYGSPTAKATR